SVMPNTAAGLGVSITRSAEVSGICSQATTPSQALRIWLTVRSLASAASSTSATLPRRAFSCTRSYPYSSLPALRQSPSAPSSGCRSFAMVCRLLCHLFCALDLLRQTVIDLRRDGDFKRALQALCFACPGQAGGRRAQISPAPRRFAAQIYADHAFRAAHDADQFPFGALGIAAHAPA